MLLKLTINGNTNHFQLATYADKQLKAYGTVSDFAMVKVKVSMNVSIDHVEIIVYDGRQATPPPPLPLPPQTWLFFEGEEGEGGLTTDGIGVHESA